MTKQTAVSMASFTESPHKSKINDELIGIPLELSYVQCPERRFSNLAGANLKATNPSQTHLLEKISFDDLLHSIKWL